MFFLFSTAKPLHHHGQECLRLKVDVVGPHGKSYQFFILPSRHFFNLYWIIRTTEALLTAQLYHLILGSKNKNKKKTVEKEDEMEVKAAGGVHNPSNRLPAGENFSSVTLLFASGCVSICFRKDVEFLDFPSQGVSDFTQVTRSRNVLIVLLFYFQMTLLPWSQLCRGAWAVRVFVWHPSQVSSRWSLYSSFCSSTEPDYKKTLWTLVR